MSKIETGGPAFPVPMVMTDGGQGIVSANELDLGGMTLRDYFAAKAVMGLVCSDKTLWPIGADESDDPTDAEYMARTAYLIADAMLKAREAA